MRLLWNRTAPDSVHVGMFTADAIAFLSEIADDSTPGSSPPTATATPPRSPPRCGETWRAA
ncbi:hypothetical protein, partial [Pseudonocardia abyssalis]